MREVWYCDDHRCDVKVETDQGDGPPDDWGVNVDNDDFCPKHAALLDPYAPELDEEWGTDTAQQKLERGPR